MIIGCTEKSDKQDIVVLLHGIGRRSSSMALLKHRLEKSGYTVVSESYASTDATIKDHVVWLEGVLKKCCQSNHHKTHFVTHSMGGIVLRMYLQKNQYRNLGRVVMLSPPNKGSEVADYFKDWKLYQYLYGPSGQELGTEPTSTPNTLGSVGFELGVITGNSSIDPLGSFLIPGPSDGRVSVDSAKVEGMKDFLVVKHSHPFIMNAKGVAEQIVSFIETGAFLHKVEPQ